MEIWIPVLIAILSSSASFFGAIYKGKNDMKKMRVEHEKEMTSMGEAHRQALEKLSAELDGQAKLYEQNKQTDVTGELFGSMMKNPKVEQMIMTKLMEEMSSKK